MSLAPPGGYAIHNKELPKKKKVQGPSFKYLLSTYWMPEIVTGDQERSGPLTSWNSHKNHIMYISLGEL